MALGRLTTISLNLHTTRGTICGAVESEADDESSAVRALTQNWYQCTDQNQNQKQALHLQGMTQLLLPSARNQTAFHS